MKNKTLLMSAVVIIAINGCGGGASTKTLPGSDNSVTKFYGSELDKALHSVNSDPASAGFVDLAGSALIERNNKEYRFIIEDDLTYEPKYEGKFFCKDTNNCLAKIPNTLFDPTGIHYFNIVIYSNENFVGASSLVYSYGKFSTLNIKHTTTGAYLAGKLQHRLGMDSIEFKHKYDSTFKVSFDKIADKKLVDMQNIIYFYLKYLMTNKSLSYDQALTTLSNNISNGSVEIGFSSNPNNTVSSYYNYIENKQKLEADAATAKATTEFKEKFTPIVDIIAKAAPVALTIAEKIYPAAKSASGAAGQIKPAYDFALQVWDFINSGSYRALGVLTQLEKEINTYSIPDPDIKDVLEHIQAELDEGKIYDRYKDLADRLNKIYMAGSILRGHLQNFSIEDYLDLMVGTREYTINSPQLSWIAKNGPFDDGLFDHDNMSKVGQSAIFISDPVILKAYIHALQNKLHTGTDSKHHINLIENRRIYNQLVTEMMLKITSRLSDSYLLYKDALYLAQKSKYKDSFIGLIDIPEDIVGVNYETSLKNLDRLYKIRFEDVSRIFNEAIVSEYDSVPNYNELSKTCNFTFSDGYEKLEGYCNYNTEGGIKENKTSIIYNPNTTVCLNPRNYYNGIANIGGELSCLLKNIVWAGPGQYVGSIYINGGYNYPAVLITPEVYNQRGGEKLVGKLTGDYKNISERDNNYINILTYTDKYENTGLSFALKGKRECYIYAQEGRTKPVCEDAPVLGCVYDKCKINNDGHSLNFGLLSLDLTTSWRHDPYNPVVGGNELYVNDKDALAKPHVHTDVASGNNQFLSYFHVDQDGAGFSFDQSDVEKTLASINNNLIIRGISAKGTKGNHWMSFELSRKTALGIPITFYFHDERGNSQSCFATIYNTMHLGAWGYGNNYITGKRYDTDNAIKCGDKYKLTPKNWPHNDTINIGYW